MQPTDPAAPEQVHVSGSIAQFRIFGIPVRFHFTFILLLIFLVVFSAGSKESFASGAVYVSALFASVLLHELGHALVARSRGIRTTEIIMFPIGGVSRLATKPAPGQELAISLTGPLVNLLIAAAIYGWLLASHQPVTLSLDVPSDANLLHRIAAGNLILGLFNLLPAFPMDGGRILRSVLALSRPEDEATRIAARAGQMLAGLMILYGLISMQFMLVFIAFFVYLGAQQEGSAAVGRSLVQGVPVRAVMVTDYRTLAHGQTIREAVELLLSTSQQDFPVMHGDQVTGLLGRNRLLRAMATVGPDGYVAGSMDRDFVRLAPDMDLTEAIPKLAEAGSCVLVMAGDQLLGLLTTENLSEYLLLRRFGMPAEMVKA